MNNITDALVYAEIKNNLFKNNYDKFDQLTSKIGLSSYSDLDKLLKSTIIKKGCCNAKESDDNPDTYDAEVYILDDINPYEKKIIKIDKKLCDKNNIYIGNPTCSKFKTLYCENSKYLYNLDTFRESWKEYSDFCSNYTFIEKPKVKSEYEIQTELEQQKLQTDIDEYIKKELESSMNDWKEEPKLEPVSEPTSPSRSIKKKKSNTLLYIISGVVIFFVLIIIGIIVFIILKKKKNPTITKTPITKTQMT